MIQLPSTLLNFYKTRMSRFTYGEIPSGYVELKEILYLMISRKDLKDNMMKNLDELQKLGFNKEKAMDSLNRFETEYFEIKLIDTKIKEITKQKSFGKGSEEMVKELHKMIHKIAERLAPVCKDLLALYFAGIMGTSLENVNMVRRDEVRRLMQNPYSEPDENEHRYQ